MTATIPDNVVAEYLADPSNGLSLLSIGDPMIHRSGLPTKEYYCLTYPGLTKQVHFVNPKPVSGNKDAIITAQMRFSTVPKNIGLGQHVALGVLRTNNPLWIKAIDDSRDAELAEGGVCSILIAEEMVEATKSHAQRMADRIVDETTSTLNPLIREQKSRITAQEQELNRLRAIVAKLSADKAVTTPSEDLAVDPDVDLDSMASGDALGDATAEPSDEATARFLKPPAPDDDVMLEEARKARGGKRK
jgi:hypothetical protein